MLPDDHSATSPALSVTGSFVPVPCPKCDGTLARRSHRDGLAEKMLSLMYVYPFRCQLCGHRFFSLQWGIRYERISTDPRKAEHRDYDRHLVHIPVRLFDQHGEFHGKTTDLSIGGCALLMASGPFRKHSQWSVQFWLPAEPHPVMVDDAVVRTVRHQQIGMEFLWTAPAERERFSRFLQATWKQTVADINGQTSRPIPGPDAVRMTTQPGRSLLPH